MYPCGRPLAAAAVSLSLDGSGQRGAATATATATLAAVAADCISVIGAHWYARLYLAPARPVCSVVLELDRHARLRPFPLTPTGLPRPTAARR
jgi:hypothetical protein